MCVYFILLHKATPVDKPQLGYMINKLYKVLNEVHVGHQMVKTLFVTLYVFYEIGRVVGFLINADGSCGM